MFVLCNFSGVIDDKPLRFRGELYHPYHFNCTACSVELNSEAREVRSRPGYAANEMVIYGNICRKSYDELKNYVKILFIE